MSEIIATLIEHVTPVHLADVSIRSLAAREARHPRCHRVFDSSPARLRWRGVPKSLHRAWTSALVFAAASAEAGALALRPRAGTIQAPAAAPEAYFTAELIDRARRYARPQQVLHAANKTLHAATLIWLVRRGTATPLGCQRSRAAAASGAALVVTLTAVSLPLDAVARKRALDAGLATQSWRGWAADVLRASALGAAFSAGGAALACSLVRRFGDRWWLPASAGVVAVASVATFAGPVLLDPIFNDFTPLPPGDLRRAVLAIAERAGVRIGEVFEVDASRRSSTVNAYVAGLGRTRRVVLFDTLIDSFTPAQTRLVVAHELAHVAHRDVPRGLLYGALVAPAATRATAQLAERLDSGVAGEGSTLPALALAGGAVGGLLGIVARQLSRAIERRADSFSLELTDDPESFISFEQRITEANLADPDPPRVLSLLLGTHPTTVQRIGIAQAYRAGARPTPRRRRSLRTRAGS
jgi:STE24 endopeptidase